MSATEALRPEPGWGRKNGQSVLAAPVPAASGGSALDRILIAERIARYGWAYDEQDTDALGECFTEDGVWEGSLMGSEQVGPFVGREAVVEFLSGWWDEIIDQRRHVFTNVVVDELGDDTATAHAYLVLFASKDALAEPKTPGPYRLELVREEHDGLWRLKRLVGGWDAPFV